MQSVCVRGGKDSRYGQQNRILPVAIRVCARRQTVSAHMRAYEIVNDELRDYRFYKEDMLHPSEQAVNYIWERLVAVCFSERAKCFLKDWAPVKAALSHRPFHPEAPAYKAFQAKTQAQIEKLGKSYPEHDFSNFTNITL